MEKILTLREFTSREIPRFNRTHALTHPITALLNLVIPLIKEKQNKVVYDQLMLRIKKIERKANKKITILEKWMMSQKSFIKISDTNKWGKRVSKKLYRREIEEDMNSLITWIFSEIVYKLLYTSGIDIFEMKPMKSQ